MVGMTDCIKSFVFRDVWEGTKSYCKIPYTSMHCVSVESTNSVNYMLMYLSQFIISLTWSRFPKILYSKHSHLLFEMLGYSWIWLCLSGSLVVCLNDWFAVKLPRTCIFLKRQPSSNVYVSMRIFICPSFIISLFLFIKL